MEHIDTSPVRYTSVTIRATTRLTLKLNQKILSERQLDFSEQRLIRECLRLALQFWRGRKDIAKRNKRYNKRDGDYEIIPLYTTEALRSAAWTRCHHSGISLSRLIDFAIANYLNRVVERWLSFQYSGRDPMDVALWQKKYDRRRPVQNFLISYDARTEMNTNHTLAFSEKIEILPWPPPKTPFIWPLVPEKQI